MRFLLSILALLPQSLAVARRDSALRPRASITLGDALSDTQAYLNSQVRTTIQQDVQATLDQFKDLPDYVSSVVKQAVTLPLSQANYNLSATEQLQRIQEQVTTKLQSIQNDVIADIAQLPTSSIAEGDRANFTKLQACIGQIVAQGGLQEGQNCLSESGYAVSSLRDQFVTFVNVNDFKIPAQAINAVTANITKFLDSNVLYPGAEALISQTQGAIQNVQLTQAAILRDASISSFDCFVSAISMISTVALADRYLQCDYGNTATTTFANSTLNKVEQSYIAATNQYSGYLPPNIVSDVQSIGLQALSVSLDPYQNATRNAINDAILSSVATTSGETASLAISLVRCLNTLLDLNQDTNCNPETDASIVKSQFNIYRNYLSQFVSILPQRLVLALNQKTTELAAETNMTEDQVRSQLQALFDKASVGAQYDSCYNAYLDCVTSGLSSGISQANSTCEKGSQCQNLPQLTPTRLDGTSPYSGIAGKRSIDNRKLNRRGNVNRLRKRVVMARKNR